MTNYIDEYVPSKPGSSIGLVDVHVNNDPVWLEVKYDGFRGLLMKDMGGYVMYSSSGSVLGGNFTNIIKELKPYLDKGYIFDGEIFGLSNGKIDWSASASAAKGSRNPPDYAFLMVFDCAQVKDMSQYKDGTIKSDKPIRERRLELLNIIRELRPKQVRASKRYKIRSQDQFNDIIATLKLGNEEGFVIKKYDQKLQIHPDTRTADPTVKHKFEYTGTYKITGWAPMETEDPVRAKELIGSITIEIPDYGTMNANIGNGFDYRRVLRKMADDGELIGKYAVVQWYGKSTSASTAKIPRAPLTMYDIADKLESRSWANRLLKLV